MQAILDTKIKITEIKNPLDRATDFDRYIDQDGKSIEEIVDTSVELVVSLNGAAIERANWAATVPRSGDHLVVIPVIGDKEILIGVGLILLYIYAPHIAVALGGAGEAAVIGGVALSTYGVILTVAIVIGGGMLINSLAGTGLGNDQLSGATGSQSYGWNPTTAQRQGLPIARAYGKNSLRGNVISVYSEPSGTNGVDEVMNILIGLGQGPVKGITQSNGVDDDIYINDQLLDNYQDVTFEERLGLIDQTVVSYFATTKPEYRPQWIIENTTGARTYVTPDLDFDEIEIQINFARGIYNGAGASLSNHTVGLKIEISEKDAAIWSTLVDETVTANSAKSIRKNYVSSGTYTGGSPVSITNGTQYDIRVTKTTADKNDVRFGDDLTLFAVREVINDSFQYPRTSLLGISALASRQLSGGLNVAVIQEGAIVAVYNGTAWTFEYSNNPAWVLWDILTQPVISGDGASPAYAIERYDGIDPGRLDLAKFYELALFCDQADIPDGEGGVEKRITFNGVFDTDISMWEAAQKVCEIARCSLVWSGVKLTLAIDKADDFVQLFSVTNIHRESFKQIYLPQNERATEIEVHYRDADRFYERVPFSVVNDEILNFSNKVTLDLFGITKQSEAYRAAVFKLAQTQLLKSVVEFDANAESITAQIGDVIAVQHDVPMWGNSGKVVSATIDYIITNQDQEYAANTVYDLMIRYGDPGVGATEDLVVTKTVANGHEAITGGTQGSKEFEIAGDKSAHYKDGDMIVVVGSTGNDETYTVDIDSVFGSVTTITVEEVIASSTFDGGLYNIRRIVPTVAFTVAPVAKDIYVFGIENLATRLYRLKSIRRSINQNATLTAIEYDPSIYNLDDNEPNITMPGYVSPQTSPDAYVPPIMDDIMQQLPESIYDEAAPSMDIPYFNNLRINDNDPSGGSVSWEADDGVNPITVTYRGVEYEIVEDNSSDEFIYWKITATTVFSTATVLATVISDNGFLMILNTSGSGSLTTQIPVLHGGVIQAGTLIVDWADINNVSIQTADIDDLQVTSAKIGNLEVGTSNIANNATTLVDSELISGSQNSSSSYTNGASATIVSQGGPIEINYSIDHTMNDYPNHTMALRRGTTELIVVAFDETQDGLFSGSFLDTPGSGSQTYHISHKRSSSSSGGFPSASVSNRLVYIKEFLK